MGLDETILTQLSDASIPLWWPGLAARLVDWYEHNHANLLQDYSSTRHITRDQTAASWSSEVVSPLDRNVRTVVESLDSDVAEPYRSDDVQFFTVDELCEDQPLCKLERALNEVAVVPELGRTVTLLARRLHALKPNDDAYDVSFSQPDIPFSIFVSIPQGNVPLMQWRVAEAIVHETMHLQLSLVERVRPLISSPSAVYFSPWRNTERTAGGVLHALYVFGVIFEWLGCSRAPLQHVQKRRSEIVEEVRQLASFPDFHALTHAGASLSRNIISKVL